MNVIVDLRNVCLETDRLFIREWKLKDLEDFYEYAKVDGVGQMAGWNPHTSKEESKEILYSFIEGKSEFAIELKENNKVVGSVGLNEIFIDLGEPYTDLKGREIGYVLSKKYWGKGIMSEAVKRVIQFCFVEEKFDFLQCSHSIENNQSKRVIEKCGFTFIKEHTRKGTNEVEHISKFYVLNNLQH
ncbi:GNAT family N-acetyltransferase [Candidatus Galacturonibacter soehngenii]|uniref:GNAT family N-acetyltransferase n=1 Tax=Candidatus Galacturonatibacter soehngenii TaxID=2307010 RepID=A0A7V7QJ02_9FIRM|nr:GNAT family N-acetyltransferase [Candidatus Galacturonibacter soehngenii]KAB1437544.1 GNAT family N-acetyltransferase [Candidatus Galacturonibacter soehngenii]